MRFKAYLSGSVMFHLAAAAALIYGLYLLHPLCLALFLVGIGIETHRVPPLLSLVRSSAVLTLSRPAPDEHPTL
jgi:hypothetical protein